MSPGSLHGPLLRWLCLILLAVFAGFPAFSGEKPDNPLTISRAVETALANNPGPAAATETIRAAEHRYRQALSALYPSLDMSGAVSGGRANYHKYDTASLGAVRGDREASLGLEGRYTLYDGFFNRFNSLKARHDLESEKNNAHNINRLLAEAVKLAYTDAMLAEREMAVNREDLAFQENMLRESRLKREADLVAEPHVLNFLLRRNRARRNLLARERDYAIRRTLLAQVMGLENAVMPDSVRLNSLPTGLPEAVTLPPVDDCLARAEGQRPDLLALASERTAAEFTLSAEKSRFFPTLSLVGRAGVDDDKTYYDAYDNDSSGYTWYEAGLEFSWELYDAGSRRQGVLAAGADLNRIQWESAEKRLAVAGEVRTAHAGILRAMEQYAITLENIGIQKKQRELVTEQFRAGEVDLAFLNETQQELVSLEQELALAGHAVLTGLAGLESAMGLVSGTDSDIHSLW